MSNWIKRTLKDASIKIIDGDRGVNYPKKTEFYNSGFCLFLNTGNVTKTGFDFSNKYFITKEKDELLRKGKLKRGDIVLTTRGTVGNVGYFNNDIEYSNIRINSGMVILRIDENKISPYYLYLFLRSELFKNQVLKQGSGSAQPQLPIQSLNNIVFPWFPIETQKQIAKVLSDLDAKIEVNNKINAELEAMAKLIYDYWFVQFDFPDENGKPYKSSGGKMVFNKELKREIPEGWEVESLASILKHNYSSIGQNDNFPEIEYLDTSSLTLNVISETQLIKTEIEKVPSRAKRIVNANDILYSTVRPNLCHFGIIKHPKKAMIASTGFAQLSSKIKGISNDLIYTFLTSEWITQRLHQIAALSVSAYPSVSPNDILELKVTLPKDMQSLELANSKFNTIYTKISVNQKENQKLSELRDWLLPMLMNGQVSVTHSRENRNLGESEEQLGMVAEEGAKYGNR